jgi:cytochrome c biogenesis protein CcdA
MDRMDSTGLQGQFAGGLLLGAVWSPCIGPTLGGAIALAAQGESLLWAAAIMAAFATGVSTLILTLGYGARAALKRHQPLMRRIAEKARPFMGGVFIAVGVALLLRLHHLLDGWLLGILPAWFVDLSVAI